MGRCGTLIAAMGGLILVGIGDAQAGTPVVLGVGPPVTLSFPPPIYVPAPLPYTPPPGIVVQPVNPLPPLMLRVVPPAVYPLPKRQEHAREQPRH